LLSERAQFREEGRIPEDSIARDDHLTRGHLESMRTG
jgi:hypothetical protein